MAYTVESLKHSKTFTVVTFMFLSGVRTSVGIPQKLDIWTFSFNTSENQLYVFQNSQKIKVLNQDEVLYKLSSKNFKSKHISVRCEKNISFVLGGNYKQIELTE